MFNLNDILKLLKAGLFIGFAIYVLYLYKDRDRLYEEKKSALQRSVIEGEWNKLRSKQAENLIKSSEQQANAYMQKKISGDCESVRKYLVEELSNY